MPFEYKVYKTQRISLASFRRAASGPPKLHYPDIDDRGYFRNFDYSGKWPYLPKENLSGFDRGPVVGITAGNTSFVEMKRERIENNAPLFATSSNQSVMTVSPTGELPKSGATNLQIEGKMGAGIYPLIAKVEIRYGSKTGVIIAELTVFVFTEFKVNLLVHVTKIRDENNDHFFPSLNQPAVIDVTKAIWEPCGISFLFNPQELRSERTLRKAGEYNDSLKSDAESLYDGDDHLDKAINIYFVNEVLEFRKGGVRHQLAGSTTSPVLAKSKDMKPGIAVSMLAAVAILLFARLHQ